MTREETLVVLGILKTSYPGFYKDMNKKELENIVDLWCEMFSNDYVNVVKVAVKELIQTSKFVPTIADVKEKIYELTTIEKTPSELWGELEIALKDSIYHSKEQFEKLSPEVQKFVRNSAQLKEMAMMNSDVVHSVTKGQFFKQIDLIQKRIKEDKQMLPEAQELRKMTLNVGQDVNKLLRSK
jgi:hypothetical protein